MSSSSGDVEVPDNYVPSDVLYLLNEWHPDELTLEQTEQMPASSDMLPPNTTTIRDISTTGRHRVNRTTRRAGFYDKHLADHLILRRVKLLDSLVDSIAGTVDKAIKDASRKGPLPRDMGLVQTEASVRERTDMSRTQVKGEDGVAEYYYSLTTAFCLPIASTLALHPMGDRWSSLLNWSKEQNEGGWAIADGHLKLTRKPTIARALAVYESYLKHVDPETRELLDVLNTKRGYPDLAIWEMKSLTVGDAEVMENIVEMGLKNESFPWKECQNNCGRSDHDLMDLSEDVQPRGSDALEPQWTLPVVLDDSTNKPDEFSYPRLSKLRPLSKASNTGPSGSKTHNLADGRRSEGKKRKYEEEEQSSDWETDGDVGEDTGTKDKVKQKTAALQRKAGASNRKKGMGASDGSYKDVKGERRDVSAQSFLQQAWAQSVRNRCTILVLHSGNHELIGVRHRRTQTLFISHLIIPHSHVPTYGKIHVGIYIAAIRDALDRLKQDLKAGEDKEALVPSEEGHDNGPNHDADKRDGPDDSPSSKRRKINPAAKDAKGKGPAQGASQWQGKMTVASAGKSTDTSFCDEIAKRDVVFMHFCYGIYASPYPATFVRKTATTSHTPSTDRTPSPIPSQQESLQINDSMDILLTSEMRPGSTGIVHIGKMEVEPLDQPIQVAVKLAFSEEEKEGLEHEHRMYLHLQSKGVNGIPLAFGLFVDDELIDCGEGPYALIMSFAGDTILRQGSNIVPSVKSAGPTTSSVYALRFISRSSLPKILKAIHKAGVIHGDIAGKNICATTSGEAFIIDFSHAEKSTNPKQKAREMRDLYCLLGIEERKKTSVKPSLVHSVGLRRSARLQAKEKARPATNVKGRRQRA